MARNMLILRPERQAIRRAVAMLRRGGVVGFPTDTVYGLGAHSGIASAIEKLFQVKERERLKAIPLLIARTEDLSTVAVQVPDIAWRLAERFWPGPVTLVVPKGETVLDILTGGASSVAVRVPAHQVALQLIAALGTPLATTSANLSGQPEAATAEEAYEALRGRVRLLLDGGRCPGGVASTVVDVTTDPPSVRRRGAMVNEVEAFLSQVR
jgi:L-threonylcarbamoyladenylate synthase